MQKCPICNQEKDDVRVRGTQSVRKGNPEQLKIIKMCSKCWEAHRGPDPADHGGLAASE